MPLVRQVPVIRGYRPLLVRLAQIYKRKDDLARLGRTYERKDDGNERAVSAAVLMALADFLADNGLWLSVRLLESASTLTDPQGNRAIIWSFGQLATTSASQSAWWQVPARRSTARRVGTRKREGSGGEGSGGYGTRKRRPRSRSPRGVFDAQERNCRGCQATYSEP